MSAVSERSRFMPKAVNWPESFYNEVLAEESSKEFIALRPGSLYFDNAYYQKGDIVDIRVNGNIVRRGLISDEMQLLKISGMSEELLSKGKTALQQKADVISFLKEYYQHEAVSESIITIIFYKNLP